MSAAWGRADRELLIEEIFLHRTHEIPRHPLFCCYYRIGKPSTLMEQGNQDSNFCCLLILHSQYRHGMPTSRMHLSLCVGPDILIVVHVKTSSEMDFFFDWLFPVRRCSVALRTSSPSMCSAEQFLRRHTSLKPWAVSLHRRSAQENLQEE